MNFSWLSHSVQEVNESTRQVILAKEDFCLFNPNTFNCPIFRTRNDFDLTKKIYKATPIIFNERTGDNPWEVSFMLMFMMNTDSKLFAAEASPEKVPLYEGKMFYQFDHRYSTYEGVSQAQLNVGTLPQPSSETKANPSFNVQPRYWVDLNEVEKRLGDKWNKNWLIAFRGCLKRAVPGIVRRQGAAGILNFAVIILLYRYSLRLSLAFQTTS